MGELQNSEAAVDSRAVEGGGKEGRRSSLYSAMQEAAKVIAGVGSAAATWVAEEGIPQGQRLYIEARDWLESQGMETLWPAHDEASQQVGETPDDEDVATARRDKNDQQR